MAFSFFATSLLIQKMIISYIEMKTRVSFEKNYFKPSCGGKIISLVANGPEFQA